MGSYLLICPEKIKKKLEEERKKGGESEVRREGKKEGRNSVFPSYVIF